MLERRLQVNQARLQITPLTAVHFYQIRFKILSVLCLEQCVELCEEWDSWKRLKFASLPSYAECREEHALDFYTRKTIAMAKIERHNGSKPVDCATRSSVGGSDVMTQGVNSCLPNFHHPLAPVRFTQ
ncbi:hypothetical protein Q7C36_006027 [Tachysurus vachellii]|uniref:Uncharacterized protein n=1 Tax=Tachysurus vachellii TaxID=175792 RepID=A0AA88NLL3_TACVA|nr:hypothetical protein Q7C36_006027 [Tachysurus vachellii]